MSLYAGPQPEVILLTFAIAFLPSILLVVILRFTEKYEREPWGAIWTAFLWGATASVVLVILARGYFLVYMRDNYPEIASDKYMMGIYVSCILTPIVAEAFKLLGLFFVRDELDEAEDGLIYGGVVGLGFAATEMMLYGLFVFTSYGMEVFINTVLLRTVSIVILQASVGAIAGYGVTRAVARKHKKGSLWLSPIFFIIAVACHSIFNYIAGATATNTENMLPYTYALGFAIAFSAVTWFIIWIKIIRLDRMDSKKNLEKKKKKDFSAAENKGGSSFQDDFDMGFGPGPQGPAAYDDGYGDEGYDDDYYDEEGYDDDYDGDYDGEYYDEGYDNDYDDGYYDE